MVPFSLQHAVLSGDWSPFRLGMTRPELVAACGEPDATGYPNEQGLDEVWKYGDVEVIFFDGRAIIVDLHDFYEEAPVGGSRLEIDPWIIRKDLSMPDFIAALESAGLTCRVRTPATLPDDRWVRVPGRARFHAHFEHHGAFAGLWLSEIGPRDFRLSPAVEALLAGIAWRDHRHALGPATQARGWLRDLASPHDDIRGAAWEELHTCLWHQGTVYDASAPGARVLLAMLEHGDAEKDEEVLAFLCLLATGTADPGTGRSPGVPRAVLDEEKRIVDAVSDAIRDEAPMVAEKLTDRRPRVRAGAAALLGFTRDSGPSARVLLTHLAREADPAVRAQVLYALGCTEVMAGTRPALRRALTSTWPEQVAAALALLRLDGQVADEEVAAVLRRAKADPSDVENLEIAGPRLGDALAWLESFGGEVGEPWPRAVSPHLDRVPFALRGPAQLEERRAQGPSIEIQRRP